jgi:hypothetical protein
MENWSAGEEDRPYLRSSPRSAPLWLAVAAIIGVMWLVGFWSRLAPRLAPDGEPPPAAEIPAEAAPLADAPRAAAPPPEVRHTVRAEPAAPLPKLEHSDPLVGRAIAGLVGGKAFADMVVPENLVRRIVATVDNLPRETAPRRALPLNAVPGAFLTRPAGTETIIDPANFARYEPYVRVFELIVPSALVHSYVRAYPLFQRAYEDLGYPGRYFNDRLLEAIDDLLLAPEVEAPPQLIRGRVLYEFADPDLETRSAGQKMLMRMGADNARRVKARLWDIRREVLAASAPR